VEDILVPKNLPWEGIGILPSPFNSAGMRHTLKENVSMVLLAAAAVGVLWFILSRLRIVIVSLIPWWLLGLFVLIPILVIVLVIDHFID